MNEIEKVELDIEINSANATDEDLDRLARQLLSEVREMDVESAELLKGGVLPSGTKSADPVTVGALAIAVLPTFLPKVVEAIQAWALRGRDRTVKFKGKIGGQVIEFEGSSDDLQKLLERLEKRGKGK